MLTWKKLAKSKGTSNFFVVTKHEKLFSALFSVKVPIAMLFVFDFDCRNRMDELNAKVAAVETEKMEIGFKVSG